ncbi:MAG: alpha/beta hydrolase [Candidatus Zixiibacteriota bacterium]
MKWVKAVCLGVLGLVVLLLVAGSVYEQIARTIAHSSYPAQGQSVLVGDHSLNIRTQGNGKPTVVFESGLDQGGSMVWKEVQKHVSEFTSTVAYDRAGIMWSERGSGPKTCEAMADELYELLKKANSHSPYILVGHSLAGYVLRSFVAKHASEVAGIVFVDASHPDQWKRMPPELITSVPSAWVIRLASEVGVVRLSMPSGYPGVPATDSLNLVVNAYLSMSLPATLEEFRSVRSLADEAAQVNSFGDIPLIVITGASAGRRDEYPSEALATAFLTMWGELQEDLLRLSTRSKQVLATRSGHYVMLDQPDVVIDAIKELVNQVHGIAVPESDKQ